MALVLNATSKSATANSNVSRAEADDIMAGRLWVTAWTGASGATKDAALVWATKLLDVAYEWRGAPTTTEQALRWPRVGIVDPDNQWFDQDTVADPIKWATTEFAHELLKKDRTKESSLVGLGFSSASVGPISVSVGEQTAKIVMDLIPPHVRMVLDLYGDAASGVGGMREVRLDRA